jgi:GNAT superfamily N-acetyltransferase
MIRGKSDSVREAVAAKALASAFWCDPFIRHFYPDEAVRKRRLRHFFALTWRATASYGSCDLTPNGEAAAIWRPPGSWRIPRTTMLGNVIGMARAYGSALPRVLGCLHRMEAVHPVEPHWYLMTLGTSRAYQGQGHARLLMNARLAHCDAAGLPAYLESGSAINIPYYQRFGFKLLCEIALPDGPSFWPMWRSPVLSRERWNIQSRGTLANAGGCH